MPPKEGWIAPNFDLLAPNFGRLAPKIVAVCPQNWASSDNLWPKSDLDTRPFSDESPVGIPFIDGGMPPVRFVSKICLLCRVLPLK